MNEVVVSTKEEKEGQEEDFRAVREKRGGPMA